MTTISLLPTIVDLEVTARTDNSFEFELLRDGVAEDISDDTISFTAKEYYGGPIAIATKSNAPGSHSAPLQGKTIFTLTRSELDPSDNSSVTDWIYEIRRTDPSGFEYVHIEGKLTIKPGVGTTV